MSDLLDEGQGSTALVQKSTKELVVSKLPAMVKAMPKAMVERFKQAAISVAMTPNIAACNPESVAAAIYACARLQVYPDPVLKQAYIVPFKGRATIVLGYPGLIELARRACPGLAVHTGVVYANDEYELVGGTDTRVVIRKYHWQREELPGEILFAYCAFKAPEASDYTTVVVPRYKLDAIADSKGNVWKSNYAEMAEKTAIRRAAKFWSLSAERAEDARRFRDALAIDESESELEPAPEVPNADLDAIAEGERPIGDIDGQRAAAAAQKPGQAVSVKRVQPRG